MIGRFRHWMVAALATARAAVWRGRRAVALARASALVWTGALIWTGVVWTGVVWTGAVWTGTPVWAAESGIAGAALADETGIARFFGSYVGDGVATGPEGEERRDMDVTLEAYKSNGFSLKWITVVRGADGERNQAGVRRREIEEDFLPSGDNPEVYIPSPRGSLFQKAELPNPLKGDPMRWAIVNGDTLTVYSVGIGPAGQLETQIYHRTLTGTGLDIRFLRMEDETVRVRVTGALVRTD